MPALTIGCSFIRACVRWEELIWMGSRGYQQLMLTLHCAYHGAVLLMLFTWQLPPPPSAPAITLLRHWPVLC